MIKPTSFILNNFDKNKLLYIIYYSIPELNDINAFVVPD